MPKPIDYDTLADTFIGDKRRKNPTAKTAQTYAYAVNEFGDWLATLPARPEHGLAEAGQRPRVVRPAAVAETGDVTTDHIRCFIDHLQTRDQINGGRQGSVVRTGRKLSPGTINNRYRALQSFMKWLHLNGEFGDQDSLGANPMAVLSPPELVENPVSVLSFDQMVSLIGTCGKGRKRPFLDLRDEAILRLCFEAGGRRTELATALLSGLDMNADTLRVDGRHTKTNIGRDLPFGDHTKLAINRYLIARSRHPKAALPQLWLAQKGALSTGGLYQMVKRRGALIGLPNLHPHMFRHTFANEYLDHHGTEASLKRIGGWQSDKMVRRYAGHRAAARARAEHAGLALGDRY